MNKYNLNWGISTLGCPDHDLQQALDLADRYGITFLEIRSVCNSNNPHETLYYPENEPVMRKIAAAGRCRVLDSSFGLTVISKEARAELLKIAETADDFQLPYIRIFGGGKFGTPIGDEQVRAAADNLKWFRSHKFNVRLALETHDICYGAKDCRLLQEKVGEAFPIIWDAHHTFRIAGEDLEDSFRAIGESIVSIHFKDSHIVVPGGRIYDLIGEGTVPLAELFDLLVKNNITVPVTLEHEKFWRRDLPEITIELDSWVKFCAAD